MKTKNGEDTVTHEETTAPVEVKKTPNKETLKKLFLDYEKADQTVEAAKRSVDEKTDKRSKVVQAIFDEAGPGPFAFKGDQLKIVKRDDTFFFRGKSKSDVIEID